MPVRNRRNELKSLFNDAFRQLTQSQLVDWDGDQQETKRGILMGLPTTWFLLNLTHLFWIRESCRLGLGKDLYKRHGERLEHSTAICGDDLLAFWPSMVVDQYHLLLD